MYTIFLNKEKPIIQITLQLDLYIQLRRYSALLSFSGLSRKFV